MLSNELYKEYMSWIFEEQQNKITTYTNKAIYIQQFWRDVQ